MTSQPNDSRGLSTGNKWLILLTVAINGLIIVLDISIVNIAFPKLTRIFNTEPSVVLWVDLTIFQNRLFSGGSLSLMIYGLVQSIQMFIFPYYLIDGLGYSAAQSGVVLSVTPLMMMAGAPVSGWLSDLFGSKVLCALGLIVFSVGLFLFSRLDITAGQTTIITNLIVMAVGGTLFNSPNTSLLMGAAPKEHLCSVGALITTIRQTGMSAGITVAGLIFTLRQAHHAARIATEQAEPMITKRLALIEAFTDTMLLAMLLTLVAVLATVFISNRKG